MRHPQAGTGGHYYSHGYYGYRHGGYYGYRHGGYYGYYRPYGYSSFYYGWPYYYSSWWPYGSAGYYASYYSPSYSYGYGYPYGYDARMAAPADDGARYDEPEPQHSSRDTGRVRLEARPGDASVYVDDEFWGNARETKSLTLRSGRHAIEVVRPGFATVRRDVEVVRGETSDVLLELERQ